MRIDELLKGAYERLTFVSDTAQLDAQLLLAHVLEVSTSYFYTWPDKTVESANIERFDVLLVRRERGEPIAYLLGHQAFWSVDLEVAPCTLIPRADTERLVEVALSVLDINRANRILDLGTGTGAIALALAAELPNANVVGVDLIEDAVALAKRNASRNRISNVRFVQSSWFDALGTSESFDLIVSNPPYIDSNDEHLSQGDVRFEPKSALVAEKQGMADIEHIIQQASGYMAPNAYLVFEHGYDQALAVQQRLREAGFVSIESFQDLGGNDRVTIGQYK
ncbi:MULTISPECIES: peptide chain release factor N(5)-glutamine methyltransferase [Marinomonas]|uniref:Release factor glutamine methyltransferase n=1 Tax=Marinomonas arctica TaxID=383750 RepID=A0A7H1J4D9_9GAMM|nr:MULTISPECIES: peptide chain release factor N(5)-glutamine methyltransferase [Marinomonas]MCS7488481.1 SAM-dependent methyltransferase [Marinomonas sp. BSi20414]QNT05355.1 peptide chain release factor N(5)-glutamine methyltransferase [Marinomonas arctica]GGN38861.1 release factor glutamine methyltransferase [Marinomonas arctica]